jgi:cation:H+ antiporter
LVYVDRRITTEQDIVAVDEEPGLEAATIPRPPLLRSAILYGLSTLGIFLLAPPLASTSEQLAGLLQLSGTFFGAVFLALVTSLPEVVTTGEASRMRLDDLAIGNILGSNSFNLLILVALDVTHEEPLFASLSAVHALAALGVVVTTTIATMGLLYRVEKRLWYLEPDAVAVTLSALAFFYVLYAF